MSTIIGIDLGTTNSVCAIIERGEPRIVINEEGGRTTPSVVGFSKDGERFVEKSPSVRCTSTPKAQSTPSSAYGRPYEDCTDDLACGLPWPKRGQMWRSHRRPYLHTSRISAMVLQKLKRSAEDYLGEAVTEAVITVPAYFTDRQRQATRDAGTIARLDVLRIINEPTAAALAYVHDRKQSSRVAVYDFGGGTFDSIVEVGKDIAEVRATRGNNALGGADVDQILVGARPFRKRAANRRVERAGGPAAAARRCGARKDGAVDSALHRHSPALPDGRPPRPAAPPDFARSGNI